MDVFESGTSTFLLGSNPLKGKFVKETFRVQFLLVSSSVIVVPIRRLANTDRAAESHDVIIPVSVEADFANISALDDSISALCVEHTVDPFWHEPFTWLEQFGR